MCSHGQLTLLTAEEACSREARSRLGKAEEISAFFMENVDSDTWNLSDFCLIFLPIISLS
jgi:hypothetical protein